MLYFVHIWTRRSSVVAYKNHSFSMFSWCFLHCFELQSGIKLHSHSKCIGNVVNRPEIQGESDYVFRLSEKTVTLECVQLEALMVDENVRFNLHRQRAYFGEDTNIPLREMS